MSTSDIVYAAVAVAVLVLIGAVVLLGPVRRARDRVVVPLDPAAEPVPFGDQIRVDVIVNPIKLTEQHQGALVRALRRSGAHEVRMIETTAEDPGEQQARDAAASGADVVVACGGDGTVMSCITGLAGTDTPLAIIPQGTGNLLARNLGIPLTTGRAARVAVAGARRRIDVGSTGAERFAVIAGMGFDAAMLRDAPERAKARLGAFAYLGAAATNLSEPGFICTVTIDDQEPVRRRARTVLVGNVGKVQGGLPVLPDATIDDGLLDVAIISPRTLVQHLSVLWRFVVRRPRSQVMETFTGRRVSIEAREPQPVQLDGDVRPDTTTLVCEIEPGALLVCVPGPRAPSDDTGPDELDDLDAIDEDDEPDVRQPAPGD